MAAYLLPSTWESLPVKRYRSDDTHPQRTRISLQRSEKGVHMADEETMTAPEEEPEVPAGFIKVSAADYPALYNVMTSNSADDYLRSIGVDPDTITDDDDTVSDASVA